MSNHYCPCPAKRKRCDKPIAPGKVDEDGKRVIDGETMSIKEINDHYTEVAEKLKWLSLNPGKDTITTENNKYNITPCCDYIRRLYVVLRYIKEAGFQTPLLYHSKIIIVSSGTTTNQIKKLIQNSNATSSIRSTNTEEEVGGYYTHATLIVLHRDIQLKLYIDTWKTIAGCRPVRKPNKPLFVLDETDYQSSYTRDGNALTHNVLHYAGVGTVYHIMPRKTPFIIQDEQAFTLPLNGKSIVDIEAYFGKLNCGHHVISVGIHWDYLFSLFCGKARDIFLKRWKINVQSVSMFRSWLIIEPETDGDNNSCLIYQQ